MLRVKTQVTLRKGERLGEGGFSVVYCATELGTGRTVALKKSRVSLRIKRSLLHHEARVLKLLSGHPAIPEVYAYGRIEHFELLSMQQLHQSLYVVVDNTGPLPIAPVLVIADQMLAALSHLHDHNLVHRDIKPDNILLQRSGSWQICLIDFGFTYPCPAPDLVEQPKPSSLEDPIGVVGTLPYASLNAHEGHKLTYRDDVESLAYTLIFLLRGSLPWSDYAHHGTPCGRRRQVYSQKKKYEGLQLALGFPAEFGELVDYARSLSAKTTPDYGEWQKKYKKASEHVQEEASVRRDKELSLASKLTPSPPPPPIEVGQIVLAQLISAVTAEGYSIQEGHEDSYIQDSTFDAPEWVAPSRPAVVLDISWDDRARAYSFRAAAIARSRDDNRHSSALSIPISRATLVSAERSVLVEPEFPLEYSYFYVFNYIPQFHCLPSQSPVPATWKADMSVVDILTNKLTANRLLHSPGYVPLKSPDPDIRHAVRMKLAGTELYAQLSPLTEAQMRDDSLDWFSCRAWHDESVKACRHRDLDIGRWWTGALFPGTYQQQEGDIMDSWCAWEAEEWNCQEERDKSITLSTGLPHDGYQLRDVLEDLDEIVGLDEE